MFLNMREQELNLKVDTKNFCEVPIYLFFYVYTAV